MAGVAQTVAAAERVEDWEKAEQVKEAHSEEAWEGGRLVGAEEKLVLVGKEMAAVDSRVKGTKSEVVNVEGGARGAA